jgi:hypothetical protein
MLLHLPRDEPTIGLSLKRQIKYKLSHLIGDVHPNLIMTPLHDIFITSLYKNFTIMIHPQWFDMFTLFKQTQPIDH